jgi:hypothetical protein
MADNNNSRLQAQIADIDAQLAELRKNRATTQPVKNPSFLESAKAGFYGVAGTGLKGLGDLTGSETIEGIGKTASDWSQELAPQGPQDLTDYLAYYGAGMLPAAGAAAGAAYAAPAVGITSTMGTGLAALAGAAAVNYPTQYGGNLEEQEVANNGVIKDRGAAMIAAVPQTMMDSVLDVLVALKIVNLGGKALKAGDKAGNIFTRVIKDGATGSLIETPTEVGQLVLQKIQAGVDPTSPESLSQIAETAAVAAGMGGVFGGVSGGVQHVGDVNKIRRLDAEAAENKRKEEARKAAALNVQRSQGLAGLQPIINQTKVPRLEYMGAKDAEGNPIESEPIGARFEYTADIAKRVGMFADPTPGVDSRPSEPIFNLDGLGGAGKEIKNYYEAAGIDYQGDTIPLSQVMKLPAGLKQKVFDAANGIIRDPISPKTKKIPGKPYSPQQRQAIIDKLGDEDITSENVSRIGRLFKPDNTTPYIEEPVSPVQTVQQPTNGLQVAAAAPPPQSTARKMGNKSEPANRTTVPETTTVVTPAAQAPTPTTAQAQVINPAPAKKEESAGVTEVKQRRGKNAQARAAAPAPAVAAPSEQPLADPTLQAMNAQQPVAQPVADPAAERMQQLKAARAKLFQKDEPPTSLSDKDLVTQRLDEALASFTEQDAQRQAEARRAKEAAEAARPTVNQGSLPGRNTQGLTPMASTSGFPYGMDNNTKPAEQTQTQEVVQTVENPDRLAALEAMGYFMIEAQKKSTWRYNAKNDKEQRKAGKALDAAIKKAKEHFYNAFPNGTEDQFNTLFMKTVEEYKKAGLNPYFQKKDSPGKSEYVGKVPIGKAIKPKTTKTVQAKADETATSRSDRDKSVLERAQRFLKGAKKTKVNTQSAGTVDAIELGPWMILKMGEGKYKIYNTRAGFPEAVAKRISSPNYSTAQKAAEAMSNEIENFLNSERMRPFLFAEVPDAAGDVKPQAPTNQTAVPKTETKPPKDGTKAAAKERERLLAAARANLPLDLTSFETFKAGFKKLVKKVTVAPRKDLGLKPKEQDREVLVNGKYTLTPVYKKTPEHPYGDTSKPVGWFVTVIGTDGNPEVRPDLKKGKAVMVFKHGNLAVQAAMNSELAKTGNKPVAAPPKATQQTKAAPTNQTSVLKPAAAAPLPMYDDSYMGAGNDPFDPEENFSVKPGTTLSPEGQAARQQGLKEARVLLGKAMQSEKEAYGNSKNVIKIDKNGNQFIDVEGVVPAAAKDARAAVKKAKKIFDRLFPEDDGSSWENFVESKPLNAPRPEYSPLPPVVSALETYGLTKEEKAEAAKPAVEEPKPVTPAVREKAARRIKAAVDREYDLDAARVLIEDLVAEGVLEKAGDGVYRKVNAARKFEEIARRLAEFDEANRVSRVDTTEPATRLVFEVRQIANPNVGGLKDKSGKLPEGQKIGLMRYDPKAKKEVLVMAKEGTATPKMFKSPTEYQEELARVEKEFKEKSKVYEDYLKKSQAGEWPADQPKVPKPVREDLSGRPVVLSQFERTEDVNIEVNGKKKKTKSTLRGWEPDAQANKWVVVRTGYGASGRMVKEQVEAVFDRESDANTEAKHLRKMASGMGYEITEADINQAEKILSSMEYRPDSPKTDGMKVVFTALKDVFNLTEAQIMGSGAPLNLTPEQIVKVLGAEMKNSSNLPDDQLKKKYGELYTTLDALINEMFANTGLSKHGVSERIVDLINNNPGIQGSHKNKLISIAFAATVDPKLTEQQNRARIASVFTHETFHAFKHLGLISQEEINELYQLARTKKAANGKTYLQNSIELNGKHYDPIRMSKSPNAIKFASERLLHRGVDINHESIAAELVAYSEDVIQEEAVSEMAADWAAGKIMPAKADGFFKKIIDFFMRMFKAGNSRYPAERIFEDMADGTMAKRPAVVNKVDGTKFSIKVDQDHIILVHRARIINDVLDNDGVPLDRKYSTTLQVVNRETGEEIVRTIAQFNYAMLPNGDIDPTASVMRAFAEVERLATPSGMQLDGLTIKKILNALGRHTQIRMAGGKRISGMNKDKPVNADGMNQVFLIKSFKQVEDQELSGFEEYSDADLFSEEDFYKIDTALQEDSDETLKDYGQTGRLGLQSVNAMMAEGLELRQAVKDNRITNEDIIKQKDKKDVMNDIGIPDEYQEVVSIPQLLMIQNWIKGYVKRPLNIGELKDLLAMDSAPPQFFFENNIPPTQYNEFFESQLIYDRAEGFSGVEFTDNDFTGELFSTRRMLEEDQSFKAGADMGLDPFGDLNEGLGERFRPSATQNRTEIMDTDYAYTTTLRHIQWFANKMTPAMVKNVFGINKDDVDNFVQRWHASFVDANTSIGYIVDHVRKAGGYIDDRTDVYLQAELKSDEIIPEIERVRREYVEPIVEFMASNGISIVDANDFLNAMHAPERNDLIRKRRAAELARNEAKGLSHDYDAMYGSGTTEEDAANALKVLESEGKVVLRPWLDDNGNVVPGRYETASGKLHEFGKLYQGLIAETNRIREANGLIPSVAKMMESETYPNFRYYAPLKGNESLTGDAEIDNNTKARVGVKYGASGLEDKHATGRFTKASRILEHTIMQNYDAIIRAKRANVGQAFHEFVSNNQDLMVPFVQRINSEGPIRKTLTGDGRVIKTRSHLYKTEPEYFVTKIDGQEVVYQFTKGPDGGLTPQAIALSRAMRGFSRPSDANTFVKTLQRVNQILAKLNTAWNPEFTVTNLIRDLGLAMFNIGQYDLKEMQKQILSNWKPAYTTIRAYDPKNIVDEAYMKLDADGNTFTDPKTWTDEQLYHALRSFGGLSSFYERMDIGMVNDQLKEDLNKAAGTRTKPKMVMDKIKTVVGAIENWNTAIEHATRLAAFKAMLNQGVSLQRAAQATKNLTVNFNKGGEQRVLMNALYLFYNASIQGTFAMLNAMHRNPALMKTAMYIVASGFMADMANDALSDEEPDGTKSYDSLKAWKKESAINIPVGNGQYLSIPLPWGLSFFWNIGRASSYAARTGNITEATGSMMSGLVSNFSPIGSMENMANFFAPTILDPIINVSTNTSWDGRAIQPMNLPFGPQKPNSQLYWNSTSGTMKETAAFLNSISGGDENFSGLIDISPEILNYGANFLLGGAGMFVIRGGDFFVQTAPDILSGEDWDWNQIPFFRRAVTGTTKRSGIETYSKNLEDVVRAENALKTAYETGDAEKAQAYMETYGKDIQLAPALKAIQSERVKVKSAMKEIRNNAAIDPDEKARILKTLREKEMELVYQANRLYNER